MDHFQKQLIGHALLVILVAMFAGFMLAFSLTGGMEVLPGQYIAVAPYGSVEGWARAHTGGVLNGLLMIAVAWALPLCAFSPSRRAFYAKCFIFIGWANTLFYWFGNAAANRALSFSENAQGASNLFGAIGYGVALLGGALTIFIVLHMALMFLRK